MAKLLAFVSLSFFRYQYFMSFAFCREYIFKIVSSFHCFNLEIIRQPIVNKYYIFYYDNSFLSLFSQLVFFIYVWSCILDCNFILLAKLQSLMEINFPLLSIHHTFINQFDLALSFSSQTWKVWTNLFFSSKYKV